MTETQLEQQTPIETTRAEAQADLDNIKKGTSSAYVCLSYGSADTLTENRLHNRLKRLTELDKQALLSLAIQEPENKVCLATTGGFVDGGLTPVRRRTDGVGLYGNKRLSTSIRVDPVLYEEFKEVALRTMGSTCSAIESIMAGYIGAFKQDKVNFGNTMTINGFTVNRNLRERRLAEPETVTAGAAARVVDDLKRRVIVGRNEVYRRLGEEPRDQLPEPGKQFERLVIDVENKLRSAGCLVVFDKDKVAQQQVVDAFRPFIGRAVEELRVTVTDEERSREGYRGLRDRVGLYVESRYPAVEDRFRDHVVNKVAVLLKGAT